MEIIINNTYEKMCIQVADDLVSLMQSEASPLFCPASGDTPSGIYKELSNRFTDKKLEVSNWSFIGLDEWAGMDGSDDGSCREYLDRQLFQPLKVAENKIFFFNGKASDLQEECIQAEKFIKSNGAIHVCLLGLGMNGHIGMNEPGTSGKSLSHIASIDASTQQVGQKYFKSPKDLSKGLTLGIGSIIASRHIFLVVSGKQKSAIVKEIIQGDISENIPATLLREHSGLRIYLDQAAAELIPSLKQ
jgi:galactosamine-6-phosphate isomerase